MEFVNECTRHRLEHTNLKYTVTKALKNVIVLVACEKATIRQQWFPHYDQNIPASQETCRQRAHALHTSYITNKWNRINNFFHFQKKLLTGLHQALLLSNTIGLTKYGLSSVWYSTNREWRNWFPCYQPTECPLHLSRPDCWKTNADMHVSQTTPVLYTIIPDLSNHTWEVKWSR